MTQTKHCMFTMFQDQTTYKTKPKGCLLANTESGAWCQCTSLGFHRDNREKAFTSKWLRPFSIQIVKGIPGSDGKFEDGIDLLNPKQNKKTRKIKGPEKGRNESPHSALWLQPLSSWESRIPAQLIALAVKVAYTGTVLLFYGGISKKNVKKSSGLCLLLKHSPVPAVTTFTRNPTRKVLS